MCRRFSIHQYRIEKFLFLQRCRGQFIVWSGYSWREIAWNWFTRRSQTPRTFGPEFRNWFVFPRYMSRLGTTESFNFYPPLAGCRIVIFCVYRKKKSDSIFAMRFTKTTGLSLHYECYPIHLFTTPLFKMLYLANILIEKTRQKVSKKGLICMRNEWVDSQKNWKKTSMSLDRWGLIA